MSVFQILFIALLIDYAFGDPRTIWTRYPHPTVIMGRVIDWFDVNLNHGAMRHAKGAVSLAAIIIAGGLLGWIIQKIPSFGILDVIVVTTLLAHNNLVKHVRAVATGLNESLAKGREEVAKIVGRDTTDLTESGVTTAAIESCAENFSDGVVAPIFWYLVLGLPGILIYKLVNTADSMIGHKTPTYRKFGWAAARVDDVLNWIPARITAFGICVAQNMRDLWDAWDIVVSDAPLHSSPNAGWPEAAMAGSLDIRLAGPRMYKGQLTDDAYINHQGESEIGPDYISQAIKIIDKVWLGIAAFVGFIALMGWLF